MNEKANHFFWKRSKLFRSFFITLAGLMTLTAVFPAIIARTSLRDAIVNGALGDPELRATVGDASLGWFSPLAFEGVKIVRMDNRFRIDVKHLQTKKTWLQLLWSMPEIGTIEIDEPQIDFVMPEGNIEAATASGSTQPQTPQPQAPQPKLKSTNAPKSTLTAVIRNARLKLHSLKLNGPVIDINGLDLSLIIQRSDFGRILSVRPGTILDHQTLTPELCDQGLQLVAPVLAGASRVEGEVSIELKRFHSLLDSSDRENGLEIAGIARLHHVTSELTNPILQIISEFVSNLLKVDPPETIRVVDNTEIAFHVHGGSVSHRGLAFVLPEFSDDVVLRSSGTVGLDGSIELTVEMSLPSDRWKDVPVVGSLTARPLELRIIGTLDDPKWELPQNRDVVEELADRLLPEDQREQTKPLAGALRDLIEGFAIEPDRAVETAPADIIQLIRSARRSHQERKQQRTTPE